MKQMIIAAMALTVLMSCEETIPKADNGPDNGRLPDIENPDVADQDTVCPHFIGKYLHSLSKPTIGLNGTGYLVFSEAGAFGEYEIYSWDSTNPEHKARFDELAAKHNDLTYKQDVVDTKAPDPFEGMVSATDYNDILIVSDKDWDSEHPAGSSLNDLFFLNVYSFYHFINSGYVRLDEYYVAPHTIRKPLSELVKGDLWCILNSSFDLYYGDNKPVYEQTHTITMTLTTDDGVVTVTETLDFAEE